jgi:hypothetical protein
MRGRRAGARLDLDLIAFRPLLDCVSLEENVARDPRVNCRSGISRAA